MKKIVLVSAIPALALLLNSEAFGQVGQTAPGDRAAPSKVGEVKAIDGAEAAVIVVRGAQAYTLLPGDALFPGDRVLTRSNGRVSLAAYGCERTLEPTTTIVIDPEVCNVAPVTIADADPSTTVAAFLPSGPGPEIGATPAVLGLLASGVGAASALSSNNSSTSAVE